MKKYIWMLLCALSLSAHAQSLEHEVLSQWFNPMLQIGAQQGLSESQDKNPLYLSCLDNIFNEHILPQVIPNSIKAAQKAGHAEQVQILEQFLSQPTEQQAFTQAHVKFKQLVADKDWVQAEQLWDAYLEQMGARIPTEAQQGLKLLAGSLNIDAALDEKEIGELMFSNAACINYMKAQVNP